MTMQIHTLSVLVPIYNEAQAILACAERIKQVGDSVQYKLAIAWNVVFVDDGSIDSSWQQIESLCSADPRFTGIKLSRNFGKEAALTAGLDHIESDFVFIIDADLQDPPELLETFFLKCQEGFDVVYGVRESREGETWFKRMTAAAFYRILNKFSDSPIPKDTGDFRLMTKSAVLVLRRLRERNRFMKGLFAWIGLPQAPIFYQRHARTLGTSKWNYWRLWNFALDGITSFSTLPLRFSTYLGLATAVFSFLFGGYILLRTVIFGVDLPGYASIMVAMMFLSGVQLMALGVIGEYLGRLVNESKQRPIYIVQKKLIAAPSSL